MLTLTDKDYEAGKYVVIWNPRDKQRGLFLQDARWESCTNQENGAAEMRRIYRYIFAVNVLIASTLVASLYHRLRLATGAGQSPGQSVPGRGDDHRLRDSSSATWT